MQCLTEDLATFAAAADAWLHREPVLHNVLLTLVGDRLSGDVPLSGGERFVRVVDGATVGAAVHTPPRGPLLGAVSAEVARALAEHFVRAVPPLVEVHGPVPAVAEFAQRYAEHADRIAVPGTAQRIFRLDAVRPPVGVPGRARPAAAADRDLLIAWAAAYAAETMPDGPPVDAAGQIGARLPHGDLLWLWEQAGTPVSTAWLSRPVAGVVRISGVYTPPAWRGRGYASGCVAHVSQYALNTGATACALYTDLSNPTSNKIYRSLGYHPLSDAAQWRFVAR